MMKCMIMADSCYVLEALGEGSGVHQGPGRREGMGGASE